MANLSALLEREASAEIETILSEARARASEIVAKAENDAKATAASRERLAGTQGEAARVRARSAAQLEASSLKLRAQYARVDKVFGSADDELRKLTKDKGRYTPILAKLLDEAVEALGGNENVAKVSVNPADEAAGKEAATKRGLGEALRAIKDRDDLAIAPRTVLRDSMDKLLVAGREAGTITSDADGEDLLFAFAGIWALPNDDEFTVRARRLVDLVLGGLSAS